MQNRIVHGARLGQALHEAGLVPSNVKRIVIDIDVTDIVKIYWETYAQESDEPLVMMVAALLTPMVTEE